MPETVAHFNTKTGVLVIHPTPVCQHGEPIRTGDECEACNDLWLIWSSASGFFLED